MAAPNLGRALIGAVAATAMTASAALAQDATTENTQLTQNFQGQATVTKVVATPETTGAPVTFLVGPGISESDMASVVRGVAERGCPVTVEDDFVPGTVTVQSRGKAWGFDEPVDAGGWALDICLPKQG